MTGASRKALKVKVLDRVPCICYLVEFCKDKGKDVLTLLDSGNEVNAITPAYAAYLDLKVKMTDVCAQKINRSSLATYGLVVAAFQVADKLSCS